MVRLVLLCSAAGAAVIRRPPGDRPGELCLRGILGRDGETRDAWMKNRQADSRTSAPSGCPRSGDSWSPPPPPPRLQTPPTPRRGHEAGRHLLAAGGSWPLHEPQIERREHHNDPDVYYQPQPELVLKEEDIHADHDGHHREHVEHNGCLSSHGFFLLGATTWNKRDDRSTTSCARWVRSLGPARVDDREAGLQPWPRARPSGWT